MFKIVNVRNTDHHIHSNNFSDGLNTIDEIVQYAGKLKLKEITITDHSQIELNIMNKQYGIKQNTFRFGIFKFKNVWNNTKINFAVEADILNNDGKVCTNIQGIESEKIILSLHSDAYKGNLKKVNEAYENAILKYKEKIICIGHPCLNHIYSKTGKDTSKYLDIERLTDFANKYKIPLELNGKGIYNKYDDENKLKLMLENAKYIMINSDAHCLFEMKNSIDFAYKWLEKEGFL